MTYQNILMSILEVLLVVIPVLLAVAYVTVAERKTMASMQRRLGPNVVGYYGLLQAFADALKLILKEYVSPSQANIIIFFLGPIITLMFSLYGYLVIPFGPGFVLGDLKLGILYLLAVSSLSTYGILLAGWSANSKYAFLGSLRSTAQLISYELILSSAILLVILLTGSLNITVNIEAQKTIWFLVPLLPISMVFYLGSIAETNRAPFDLAEAESELVSGFMTEHAAVIFVFFFLAEYASIVQICIFNCILFLAGYLYYTGLSDLFKLRSLFSIYFNELFKFLLNTINKVLFFGLSLGIKSCLLIFTFIWVRASLPRIRFDQLMSFCWTILLPVIISFIVYVPCLLDSCHIIPANFLIINIFVRSKKNFLALKNIFSCFFLKLKLKALDLYNTFKNKDRIKKYFLLFTVGILLRIPFIILIYFNPELKLYYIVWNGIVGCVLITVISSIEKKKLPKKEKYFFKFLFLILLIDTYGIISPLIFGFYDWLVNKDLNFKFLSPEWLRNILKKSRLFRILLQNIRDKQTMDMAGDDLIDSDITNTVSTNKPNINLFSTSRPPKGMEGLLNPESSSSSSTTPETSPSNLPATSSTTSPTSGTSTEAPTPAISAWDSLVTKVTGSSRPSTPVRTSPFGPGPSGQGSVTSHFTQETTRPVTSSFAQGTSSSVPADISATVPGYHVSMAQIEEAKAQAVLNIATMSKAEYNQKLNIVYNKLYMLAVDKYSTSVNKNKRMNSNDLQDLEFTIEDREFMRVHLQNQGDEVGFRYNTIGRFKGVYGCTNSITHFILSKFDPNDPNNRH